MQQNPDAVSELRRLVKIMRDKRNRTVILRPNPADHLVHGLLCHRIECRKRLVQQQQQRTGNECPRQSRTLLFTAAQRRWILRQQMADAELLRNLMYPLPASCAAHLLHPQTVGDILCRRHMRKQAVLYHLIDENNLWVHNLLTSEGGSRPHHTPGAPMWYCSGWFSTGNGIEANASTALGDKHQLSFGAKYVKIDWHTDSNNLSKGDEGTDKRTSFYIEDALSFDTKTRMTLGVRHESLSQDANNVKSTDRATDPVLNITHDLTKADTLRFSAGRTHVFVQAKSAASNIRANVAVPKPERDRNFELGWKHRFSPKAELDLAVFYTDVTDRIVCLVKGGPFYNIDQTKIRGAELGYQHKFTQKLSAFANYTWMSAEDKSNGKTTDAAGIPHQMINLGLTYREGKWRSTLLGRGVMGWYNGVDGKGKLYPNSSGYFTADLDLRYEPQTDLGVFLRINNIFSRDYQDKLYHPAEGANFLLGVDMTF